MDKGDSEIMRLQYFARLLRAAARDEVREHRGEPAGPAADVEHARLRRGADRGVEQLQLDLRREKSLEQKKIATRGLACTREFLRDTNTKYNTPDNTVRQPIQEWG